MSGRGRGGTYIRFGTGTPGQSAPYVRYISRRAAAEEREKDEGGSRFLAHGMPEEVAQALDFEEARRALVAFAKVREEEERGRSHFRSMMSFERRLDSALALSMVDEWLEGAFPGARAIAFLHHDTGKLHAHVWIDARHPDGHKISIPPKLNRELGELWNRIYCRELGLDERIYLERVQETREFKRAKARGESSERPRRVDDRKARGEENHGREKDAAADQGRSRGDDPGALSRAEAGERGGEGLEASEQEAAELARAAEGAIRGAEELRRALEGLGAPERAERGLGGPETRREGERQDGR